MILFLTLFWRRKSVIPSVSEMSGAVLQFLQLSVFDYEWVENWIFATQHTQQLVNDLKTVNTCLC